MAKVGVEHMARLAQESLKCRAHGHYTANVGIQQGNSPEPKILTLGHRTPQQIHGPLYTIVKIGKALDFLLSL